MNQNRSERRDLLIAYAYVLWYGHTAERMIGDEEFASVFAFSGNHTARMFVREFSKLEHSTYNVIIVHGIHISCKSMASLFVLLYDPFTDKQRSSAWSTTKEIICPRSFHYLFIFFIHLINFYWYLFYW